MNVTLLVDYASICAAIALAILTMLRAGRSVPRWAFVIGISLLALEAFFVALSNQAASAEAVARWQSWRLIVLTLLPGSWVAFSTTYARGKDKWSSRSASAKIVLSLILPFVIGLSLRNHLVTAAHLTDWDTKWSVRWSWPGTLLWVVMLVTSVAVVVNLERTFRASVGVTRWRIKYMLLGIGLIFVVRIYTSSQAVLFQGVDSSIETINVIALIVGAALTTRSLYRTGHFEIEVYPSRAVLQKSLTVFLAGAYLLIVGVLAKIVTYIGGDAAFAIKSFLVMAMVVLLAILIQSDRARLELRRFVSRNFRRSAYDYRSVWRTFTEGTASRVEKTELCRELATLIADTFDCLSVSLFLIDEKSESLTLGASTNSTVSVGETSPVNGVMRREASLIRERFQNQPHNEPLDLEPVHESWAVILKAKHPNQFTNGGRRICMPLVARGNALGVVVVGDRVGGIPYSVEDLEMLKCISEHAAANVLNVQLSTKLLQAREFEAFQAMAAFFVHDLKNAASTLNLMLQNFPAHFDNPDFKQDALRGIAKTAGHINGLVGRLGMLRHELKVELAEEELNQLLISILEELEHTPRFTFIKDLTSTAIVRIDREQMHKVVTNLILNATEAIGHHGEIRVRTARENDWVVLSVSDNGCGMTADFIQNSLFRPFQTTKKNGLGIGMFQSKMIIEAHHGRVAVTSEVGRGTTFHIYLPAAHQSQ